MSDREVRVLTDEDRAALAALREPNPVQVTGGLKTDAARADALDALAAQLESINCTMGDRIHAAGWLQTFAFKLRNQAAPPRWLPTRTRNYAQSIAQP